MHNFILKIFDFFDSFIKFLRILLSLFFLMFVFYWLECLVNFKVSQLGFFNNFMDFLVRNSGLIFDRNIKILGMNFDPKFINILLLIFLMFILLYIIEYILLKIKKVYIYVQEKFSIIYEDEFNKRLYKNQEDIQKKFNNYRIFISVKPKEIMYKIIDIEKICEELNYLIFQNTGVKHEGFEDGYLYSFNDFEKVDFVINILEKILLSEAPVDYVICIQIVKNNSCDEYNRLKKIISLDYKNLILTTFDTVFRYKFNVKKIYNTAQIGIFQYNNDTFELYHFIKE